MSSKTIFRVATPQGRFTTYVNELAQNWDLTADEYATKFPALNDAGDVVAYAIELESGAASADIASIGRYEDASLAVVIAQIAAVETMHWSALLAATGQNPAPVSFIPLPS